MLSLCGTQQCYFCISIDDISYNKAATQSHTALGRTGNDASKAVDRNTATCIRTLPIGLNNPETTVWWKVDLGGVYNIQSINIVFANYNGYGVYFRIKSMQLCIAVLYIIQCPLKNLNIISLIVTPHLFLLH